MGNEKVNFGKESLRFNAILFTQPGGVPHQESEFGEYPGGMVEISQGLRFWAPPLVRHRPNNRTPAGVPEFTRAVPSTYACLSYHLVFSTKNRLPAIDPNWQDRLHAYLGGTVKGLNGVPIAVGGVADHVHLAVGLRPTHCLADFVRDLKKSSSIWVHDEVGRREFSWQVGYGAFTFGADGLPTIRAYIAGQEEHHRKVSFREEFLALCAEAGVEVDLRFFD